jgi:hypothetical protein
MHHPLFNARFAQERPKPQGDSDGIWFTQLRGHAVRAHVADVGHLTDTELDGHFVVSQSMEITTPDGVSTIIAPPLFKPSGRPMTRLFLWSHKIRRWRNAKQHFFTLHVRSSGDY